MNLDNSMKDEQNNSIARTTALQVLNDYSSKATSTIYYSTGDKLLLITDQSLPVFILELIDEYYKKDSLLIVYVTSNEEETISITKELDNHYIISDRLLILQGHLGDFQLLTEEAEQEINLGLQSSLKRQSFDVVLDLSSNPIINRIVLPFGYKTAKIKEDEIKTCLFELENLQGQFQKPKYFNYDDTICAHASSGIIACQNCVQACPAEAITSTEFNISVDPYLCQGCGTCTSVCPTGAMTYAYPMVSDTLNRLRLMLGEYFNTNGQHPFILFFESGLEEEIIDLSSLPANVLPYEVEEISSTGMELWLAGLAYGAEHIFLGIDEDSVSSDWMQQLEFSKQILHGMGYTESRIHTIDINDSNLMLETIQNSPHHPTMGRATFIGLDEKRTVIRLAVEHLLEYAPKPQAEIPLNRGAPFGEIKVNEEACTLCMACVSLCPKGALSSGGDMPTLSFVESDCVQCGMCQTGCPENAIQLHPRYLYNRDDRIKSRILNEEKVFSCVSCGKPFATQKMITTIMDKLKDHYMFQGDRIKQLQMCEDCRVVVQFDAPRNKQ